MKNWQKKLTNSNIYREFVQFIDCINWMELVYLILFALYVGFKYLQTTALDYEVHVHYEDILLQSMIIYVSLTVTRGVLTHKISIRQLLFMLLLLLTGFISSYYSGEMIMLDLMLFCVGAKGVSFYKIAWVYLTIALTIQVSAFYCSTHGIAPDYMYQVGDTIRHSYGICYPTDSAAHILFMMMVYAFLRGHKISFFEITGMGILTFIVYRQMYARNDVICMGVLCVLLLGLKLKPRLGGKYVLRTLSLSFSVAVIVSITLAYLFNEDINWMAKLDALLSTRLSLGHTGLVEYGVTMFGQPVTEYGLGFGAGFTQNYFFLDSSYVRCIIKYGWVMLLLLCVLFIYIILQIQRHKKYIVLVLMLVITLFGINEHHVMELCYNPFFLLAFSKVRTLKNISREDAR